MTTEDEKTPEGEHIFTPDQPLPPDALGRYTLGYDVHDDAAAVLGKMRTEFMIESARRQAIDVLLDRRLFVLDPERFDAFMRALDNPLAPGPKLRSLLRRAPAWKR